jgi:hypothetical protein
LQTKHRKTSKFYRVKTKIEFAGGTNAANTQGRAWPARPQDLVANNIGIYPRLNRGLIFNGVTVFRLRARLTSSAIEFYESR